MRELRLRRLASVAAQKLFKQLSDGIEGRVLKKGAGVRFDPSVRCAADLLMEPLQQARFSDSRLTDDQRRLPLAVEGTLPTIHEQAQLVFAPDEWSQPT